MMLNVREHLQGLAEGDLSIDLKYRGFVSGLLKRHLANLRHLTWQVEQVAKGDFTQRVDFMGDFSDSFNLMVVKLDEALTNLRETKETLTSLTESLRNEVDVRTAAVVALQESERRLRYLADHDVLTGAQNRRSFYLVAEAGMRTARQLGKYCCIAIMDLDHFKDFNDRYGHLSGDTALKQVVRIASEALRQSDSLGRYGGEEFIFFFSDATLEQAEKICNRIRLSIAGTPIDLGAQAVPITTSMGLAGVNPDWPDERNETFVEKIISMADHALYSAKEGGRNRVCTSSETHPDKWSPESAVDKPVELPRPSTTPARQTKR
ncbi:diguanylate cyclase [Phaeovibrio sulfidiphilus]|uniref:diguanylate cyclase n=2 Tax=Phaeovibrio sulfidiphilus TaxID=1220600 RepID=A0A8J7CQL2_9PROT|nr:diguanylate cyclase [Phaeovibrio sulfidiphilus]